MRIAKTPNHYCCSQIFKEHCCRLNSSLGKDSFDLLMNQFMSLFCIRNFDPIIFDYVKYPKIAIDLSCMTLPSKYEDVVIKANHHMPKSCLWRISFLWRDVDPFLFLLTKLHQIAQVSLSIPNRISTSKYK